MKKIAISIGIVIILILTLTNTAFAGAGDDSDASYPEVGVEWVSDYPGDNDLPLADDSAEDFYEHLGDTGWTQRFNRGDDNAWERIFKKYGLENGWDKYYADAVDIVFFHGHACAGAINFSDDSHDDEWLEYDEAEWGDWDVEWVLLGGCNTLADDDGGLKSSGKFAQALNGAHSICGAATSLTHANYGVQVAIRLTDDDGEGADFAYEVGAAWFLGVYYTQGIGRTIRVIGENSDCFFNDFIWGQDSGPISDPTVDGYYNEWHMNT
jgi:hypothetical protein